MMEFKNFTEEKVKEFSEKQKDAVWLKELRKKSYAAFQRLEVPVTDEDWRRVDLSAVPFEKFHVTQNGGSFQPVLNKGNVAGSDPVYRGQGAGGRGQGKELHCEEGVIFETFEQIKTSHPEMLEQYLMQGLPLETGKFEALHGAFLTGGAFLYVPKDSSVSVPFTAAHRIAKGQNSVFPHTVVVVDEGSSVVFIDDFNLNGAMPDGDAFCGAAVEIYLKKSAKLEYVHLQRWGNTVTHFFTQKAHLEDGSSLTSLTLSLGGRLTKGHIESIVEGKGATSYLYGLVVGDGRQQFNHNTLQDHRAQETESDQLFKAALKDESKSVFIGNIRVRKSGGGTNAYQANRNLLLSKGVTSDSIPTLEIEANDVKCTHGSATGGLDEETLFYLRSRGVPRKSAENMLVEGFFEDVLLKLSDESVREKLRGVLYEKFEKGNRAGSDPD